MSRVWIFGIGLALVSLSGCSLLKALAPQGKPVVAPSVAAPPLATSPTESPIPFTVLTAPSFLTPAASAPARENYACLTANYFANITWRQDQPSLSFGRKPQQALAQNQAARSTANPDGSFTYELASSLDNRLYYARVYPDRTCLLQVIDKVSGQTSVEESGSLGGLVMGQTSPDYQQGYDKGQQVGDSDGRKYRKSGFGNRPDQAIGRGAQTGKADYDWGYREGFYAGFDQGYAQAGG
jgi:hypothetical protein